MDGVRFCTVEREKHHGRDFFRGRGNVGDADLLVGEVGVGGGDGELFDVGGCHGGGGGGGGEVVVEAVRW